jgi:hypothetical protein
LTRRHRLGEHHHADADTTGKPVPSQWRKGGPIKLAGDTAAGFVDIEAVGDKNAWVAIAQRP